MSSFFNKIVSLSIIRYLTKPWEELSAYREGLIDKNGKLLVSIKDMTLDQKRVYGPIQRIAFEIRRTIDKVPGGRKILGTSAVLMALLKEEMGKQGYSEDAFDLVEEALFNHLVSTRRGLSEETGWTPATLKAGVCEGVENDLNPHSIIFGVPVYRINEEFYTPESLPKNIKESMDTGAVDMGSGNTKKNTEKFAGIQVFTVSPEEYQKCIKGKHPRHRYSKYTENEDVREYGRRSKPGTPILVKDEKTGSMVYLKK